MDKYMNNQQTVSKTFPPSFPVGWMVKISKPILKPIVLMTVIGLGMFMSLLYILLNHRFFADRIFVRSRKSIMRLAQNVAIRF